MCKLTILLFLLYFNFFAIKNINAVSQSVSSLDNYEISESLRQETVAAIDRGISWLISKQHKDGSWSNNNFPALSALSLWALIKGHCGNKETIQKAVDYIVSCAHENGAIYKDPVEKRKGGGLSNYNTAICMVALYAVGDSSLVPVIHKARSFVASTQHLGDDICRGGMGYDASADRPYTDLSNSYIAFEAMRLTENVEDLKKDRETSVDINWEAAVSFVQRIHNDPKYNTQTWVSNDPKERGGFVYHPHQTRAGTFVDKQGVTLFRSMPGMTYAGLLCYLYGKVDRNDPRIRSTFNWIKNNWSLDVANRDPQVKGTKAEQDGLFYLYLVMAKALSLYDQDVLVLDDGANINWRIELIKKLLQLQKTDQRTEHGYWINDNGRYWESDPVLVTAYALLALEIALDF